MCYMLLGKNHNVVIKKKKARENFDFPHFAKHTFKTLFLLKLVFRHTHPSQFTYNPRATRAFVKDSVHYSL